jgi:biopolymer transport protein ExbB
MLPIIVCSVAAVTIIIERLWSLRRARVLPKRLVATLHQWSEEGTISLSNVDKPAMQSPLGQIITVGLLNRRHGREVIKESIEDAGRLIVHQLERFLNTLGTIAAITPLLGLLGTVFGMIEVFNVISTEGAGDAAILAGGISQALITTATGLTVAIPSLLFYRYFRGRVERLVVKMELEVMRLLDLLQTSPEETAP